jgi:hypothetical protein
MSIRPEEDRPTMEENPKATKRLKPTHPLVKRVEDVGLGIMNRKPGGGKPTVDDRFRADFGVPTVVCADVWLRLDLVV